MTSQQLSIVKATNDTELAAGLASIEQMRASALLVAADPFFDTRRELIISRRFINSANSPLLAV